jgi:hypothetical protein
MNAKRGRVPDGKIPIFSYDGECRGHVPVGRAERLERAGFARLVKRRTGQPMRCLMLRREQDPKAAGARDYVGQRYSFLEKLENDLHAWELKRLGRGNSWRSIFMQVVTDCLVNQGASA